MFIGQPGVGKTAIVEGMAARIVRKEVPVSLLNAKIYEINLGTCKVLFEFGDSYFLYIAALRAGASFFGMFETRLQVGNNCTFSLTSFRHC